MTADRSPHPQAPQVGPCELGRTLIWATLVVFVALLAATFMLAPKGAPPPLDTAITGYGPEDVAAYFARLDKAAALHAIGPFRWLDYLFPPLLAATFTALFVCFSHAGAWRIAGIGAALVYLVADFSENILLDGMIRAWPRLPDAETVAMADLATRTKFGALGLALVLLAIAWRRHRMHAPLARKNIEAER